MPGGYREIPMTACPPEAPAAPHPAATRFVALWSRPILERIPVRAILFVLIAGLCLVRASTGLSGIQVYSHDAFGTLDGAWRILHGQKPHADFYSPLGPIIYLITAGGLKLAGGGAEGFGYSQAVCAFLLTVWTYVLGRRRLGHLPAILMCLTIVLLALNPTSVGEPPPSTSCMFYNRYGYALAALLLIESAVPPPDPERREEFWGGFSTGAILALLLFLKISYFAGAAALAAALLWCRPQSKARWAGAAAGFLPVFLACAAYLDFHFLPMWNDFRMVGSARTPRMTWFIVDNLYKGVAIFLTFLLLAANFLASGGAREAARRIRIAGIAVLLAGLFLLSTNFQFFGLPLCTIMVILVLRELAVLPYHPNILKHAAFLVCGGIMVAWTLLWESMGLGFAIQAVQEWDAKPHTAFAAAALAGFRSYETGYVDLVNDGLNLLNQHRRPGDTVMSLDFSNPFSYALGMAPAPGGATTLHYRGNFSDEHHPPADRILGQASLVMMPITPSDKGLLYSIPRIYGPYLAEHFHLIGESPQWRLYRHGL